MNKRPFVKYLICVAIVVALFGLLIYWLIPKEEDLENRVAACDRFLQSYEELNKFNGCVLIAKDGEVLLRKGYGTRNAALDLEHDASSIFRIYSITKAFTSTVILQLVEEGKLSLDDPVGEFYSDLPESESMTIRHLLTHSSGLFEFTRESEFENTESTLLDLLKNHPLDFPPGKGWSYCNSGYCLLGHIIARLDERSYEESIQERILQKLGMNDTGFAFNELDTSRKAVGYGVFSKSNKEEVVMADKGGPFAAGALYSTVDDLLLFHSALESGELLSKESLGAAWSGCSQNPGYGFGWQIGSRWFLRKVVSHSGGADGFRSNFSQIPSRGYCVILLNNNENANVEFLTDRIYDLLDGESFTIPKAIELAPSQLERFAGFYESQGNSEVIHTYLVDGELNVDFQGRSQGSLLATSETEFFQPESDAVVEFLMNDSGDCTGMAVQQGGMTIEANKYEGPWGIRESMIGQLQIVLEKEPKHTENWHEAAFQLLPLFVFKEDMDNYRALCNEMIQHHGDTQDPQIAERTVKVCLLAPDADSVDAVGDLADRFYDNREKMGTFNWGGEVPWSGYLCLAKGIADYHRGEFEDATSAFESAKIFSTQDPHSPLLRDLFLAAAYQQTGHKEDAATLFESTSHRIESLPANYAYGMGHDRILVHLAQQEAMALLGLPSQEAQ